MNESSHDELEIRKEITVRDVLVPIWRYRKLTYVLTALGLIGAIAYQFLGVPIYTSQMTIAPLPSDLTLSQEGSSIAGLSLLSSVSGSSEGPDDFDTFIALLQAPEIAHNLEKDYHVDKYIFSSSWDAAKKKWSPDGENIFIKLGRIIFNKPWHPPTDQDLADYLTKKITVTTLGDFTILDYNFKDPKVANMVLGGAVIEAQKVIRTQEHLRADAAMAFLNRELAGTPSAMAQQALIALAIEWEQKKLLAETNLDVGVEISQPLAVSDVPTSPAILIDTAIGVGAMIFLGITISAILGLFVTDDPAVVGAWFRRRRIALYERMTGLFGIARYRFER